MEVHVHVWQKRMQDKKWSPADEYKTKEFKTTSGHQQTNTDKKWSPADEDRIK